MEDFNYDELLWDILKAHIGHDVHIVAYGDKDDPANISLECDDCNEIILDAEIYTICAREDEKADFMIDIKLRDGQSGYDAVGEYIQRYWNHNIRDTVVVSMGTSYDGNTFEYLKEIASPCNSDDIEFLYDWWEGEKFIKLLGIKAVSEIDITNGIYGEQLKG